MSTERKSDSSGGAAQRWGSKQAGRWAHLSSSILSGIRVHVLSTLLYSIVLYYTRIYFTSLLDYNKEMPTTYYILCAKGLRYCCTDAYLAHSQNL